ncbi:MAG: C2H2-type zinc finger protein [Desulfurococcaceae archaeon]|uniref:Zinc finger protein n=1 Tax=Ligamenvirales sp. TaxID=2832923 RepID=A0AAU6PXB5_9VIRU
MRYSVMRSNIYVCPVCGVKYRHVSNLVRHYRTAHIQAYEPYTCPACSARLNDRTALLDHLWEHQMDGKLALTYLAMLKRSKWRSRRRRRAVEIVMSTLALKPIPISRCRHDEWIVEYETATSGCFKRVRRVCPVCGASVTYTEHL